VIAPDIQKSDTDIMHDCVSPKEMLVVTVRYPASGALYFMSALSSYNSEKSVYKNHLCYNLLRITYVKIA